MDEESGAVVPGHDAMGADPGNKGEESRPHLGRSESNVSDDFPGLESFEAHPSEDLDARRDREIIASSQATTELERALKSELDRQMRRNHLLANECSKLRGFISKRKQTYKRKRKDESAPKKKLTGYNLFVRERFDKLRRENEEALTSVDPVKLKRIPPASNIASSGHAWRALSAEEKKRYSDMAKPDGERYEKENAAYNPPEKMGRKRNRTGYNIFFTQYVNELKQTEGGVPHERGSVARVVGDAWRKLSSEEKDAFERQADQQNEVDPVEASPDTTFQMVEGVMQGGPLGPPQLDPIPPPDQQPPRPQIVGEESSLAPEEEGEQPTPADGMHPPPVAGMPPLYHPDYAMHGPPPPVIHQPTGYEAYYGAPPPYDPYGYPLPPYPGMPPPGMPPPPGAEGMPPYPPPPPNYQGPPYPQY